MDAASIGAINALPIVAYILASVIAFFSLLGFVNSTLVWLGERIGLILPDYPPLTFQVHVFCCLEQLSICRTCVNQEQENNP
jgi:nucleoside permease NupC